MKRVFSRLAVVPYALAQVFRNWKNVLIATVSACLFFSLYLLVPVWLVPGNSLLFSLSQLSLLNTALLGLLAFTTGVLFTFELFAFRKSQSNRVVSASTGSAGLLASLAGGILAAASCGCGVGILLGVIGLGGGTVFVVANQTYIVVGMLLIVLVGVYFSARRAAGICATCST